MMPDNIDGNTTTVNADNCPSATPRNAAPKAIVPPVRLTRHLRTALARTPLSGCEWVVVATSPVVDKCDKIGEVARKLTEASRDVRKDQDQMVECIQVLEQQLKDQMVERIQVLEQQLKDQMIEVENREREQMLILEEIWREGEGEAVGSTQKIQKETSSSLKMTEDASNCPEDEGGQRGPGTGPEFGECCEKPQESTSDFSDLTDFEHKEEDEEDTMEIETNKETNQSSPKIEKPNPEIIEKLKKLAAKEKPKRTEQRESNRAKKATALVTAAERTLKARRSERIIEKLIERSTRNPQSPPSPMDTEVPEAGEDAQMMPESTTTETMGQENTAAPQEANKVDILSQELRKNAEKAHTTPETTKQVEKPKEKPAEMTKGIEDSKDAPKNQDTVMIDLNDKTNETQKTKGKQPDKAKANGVQATKTTIASPTPTMWNNIHLKSQKECDKEFFEGVTRAGDRKKHRKEINSTNTLYPVKPTTDPRDRHIVMERDSEAKKITPQDNEALIFKINQMLTTKQVTEHIRIDAAKATTSRKSKWKEHKRWSQQSLTFEPLHNGQR
ncbi:hypothetical protein FPQ18DRAFT_385554 [Pyronema domesticum]|nr:hypothetical protein FPQ18DRAFT_385554 [Pyronema domesticum]